MSKPDLLPKRSGPGGGSRDRWMVVIHNNDHTSYDDVIEVLMRATGCGMEEAAIETWEAHHYGRAQVHFSDRGECDEAAATIAQIGVMTDVLPEWND